MSTRSHSIALFDRATLTLSLGSAANKRGHPCRSSRGCLGLASATAASAVLHYGRSGQALQPPSSPCSNESASFLAAASLTKEATRAKEATRLRRLSSTDQGCPFHPLINAARAPLPEGVVAIDTSNRVSIQAQTSIRSDIRAWNQALNRLYPIPMDRSTAFQPGYPNLSSRT